MSQTQDRKQIKQTKLTLVKAYAFHGPTEEFLDAVSEAGCTLLLGREDEYARIAPLNEGDNSHDDEAAVVIQEGDVFLTVGPFWDVCTVTEYLNDF